ncbi:MAG: class I SAM-dependent methyltransferase [Proteobacteria bacterium]|nr:class I SAM-dependent methyltransferase [Pseudomonadota bacterium]
MNIEAASQRYRRHSRMAEGFAKGKMKGDPVYAAVLSHLPAQGSLVDVGCGEGYLLALAAEVGATPLYGLDHDERRLSQGRAALDDLDCTLVLGDAREAELPKADVITCLDVLHYQPAADQDAILATLKSALKPGGVLLVRDAAADEGIWSSITACTERIAMALGRHVGDGVYLRPQGEIEATMGALGLEVSTEDCSEGTPFSNVLYVGRLP